MTLGGEQPGRTVAVTELAGEGAAPVSRLDTIRAALVEEDAATHDAALRMLNNLQQ